MKDQVTTVSKAKPKSAKPTPVSLAMVLCDQILTDKATNKHVLVGTFSKISCRTLPAVHPSMGVYFALTEGRGKYAGELVLMHSETDQVIFKAEGELHFDGPLQVIEVVMSVPPIQFEEAGLYLLELRVNGHPVAVRKFVLGKVQEQTK